MVRDFVKTLRAQAIALIDLADKIEAAEKAEAPKYYTAAHLPPGVCSWRSAKATAKRLGVPTAIVGRDRVIDSAAWLKAIDDRATNRLAEKPDADAADVAALAAMGVAV